MNAAAGRPDGERRGPERLVPEAARVPGVTDPAPRTLADLAAGERSTVVKLDGTGVTVQRLAEMGLTPGAVVAVIRFAPLGDPVEVRVRGYALSLRKADARCVHVAAVAVAPAGAPTTGPRVP